jgi:hypothetical protein
MRAADVLDEGRRPPLDRIGPRLALGLAAGDVGGDAALLDGGEAHARHAERRLPALAVLQRHGRQHPVRAAGEHGQHALRVLRIRRLAQDGAAEGDRGVGAQHRRRRQAQAAMARHGRIQLERGDALHVGGGRFARLHVLQRLGVLLGAGQQQLVANAELPQQLRAPRALRCEVDERVLHSRW